jgi:nucleotide-binding universal stress UspA family protein
MPIKSILLHMANDEHHAERLQQGIELAMRFDAYLEILYIATPVSMPAGITGRGASYAYLAEATAIAHERAEEIEHEVRTKCSALTYSFSVEEGDHVELLARRTPFVDLAVVSQSHPAHLEDRVRLQIPDQLPMQAACPTIVLPWEPRTQTAGRHTMVAWKNTREAGRAVRDAIPFLGDAGEVTVLSIERPGRPDSTGEKICDFLSKHDISVDLRTNINDNDASVGEIILDVARELDCDSLVMGAYGHSRLRELIIGGTTRYILGHMDLPVLMSH